MKRALELSRQEVCYISDSDEDMRRAIALSLEETDQPSAARITAAPGLNTPNAAAAADPASTVAVPESAAVALAPSADDALTLALSEDEFDRMCSADGDLSLKERLSRSSLSSEEEVKEEGDATVKVLTNGKLKEESASCPDPPDIPVTQNKVSKQRSTGHKCEGGGGRSWS